MTTIRSLLVLLALSPLVLLGADVRPTVGVDSGDGLQLPNGQTIRPAGQTLAYAGRPFDVALSPDGKLVAVKNSSGVTLIDVEPWKVRAHVAYPNKEAGSMHGIVFAPGAVGQRKLYVTTAGAAMLELLIPPDGAPAWGRRIALPGLGGKGDSHPLGIAVTKDGTKAFVCLSINNTLATVDLKAGTLITDSLTGVCPYGVVLSLDESAVWVTNYGGHLARPGATTGPSVKTPVEVDKRGISISGTVTRLDAKLPNAEIEVGLHPTQILRSSDGARLYVANANSDSVSVIDATTNKVVETISTRPDPGLPFGSLPNALAMTPDGKTLFCANAGNNAIAVISLDRDGPSKVTGFIPTGWFPGGAVTDGKQLFVSNVKGEGSREPNPSKPGWNSRQVRGSVSVVPLPQADALKEMTTQVISTLRVPQLLRVMDAARAGQDAKPVPARAGEPSPIRHVVYVLKENRTYDQVFGDIGKGNSEPKLCIYPRKVTPNHHALAEQFVLLDNYYCNGVISADGHQWATQGITTEYQEKQRGPVYRSYDFGTDALCYAGCDFIWDSVLLKGLSFRNYGEFDFPEFVNDRTTWFDAHKTWKAGERIKFKQVIDLTPLKPYTAPDFPGWLMRIPDQYRMDRFLEEFRQFEKGGDFPNFTIVYLPQDHTSGTKATAPTPAAHVADNDLALGRLVDAISHSRFWGQTCIFVNEDDPQDGFDHVDGHRSICLVVSPYTKRGQVVSTFYNQTSVLHTMCRMLGLPPLNQLVAQSNTMEDCFTDKPDLKAYNCIPTNIPIDEPNVKKVVTKEEKRLAAAMEKMDLTRPDQINDNLFNQILWHAERPQERYPKEWAGAHGKGLGGLKLKLDPTAKKDDDDDDD